MNSLAWICFTITNCALLFYCCLNCLDLVTLFVDMVFVCRLLLLEFVCLNVCCTWNGDLVFSAVGLFAVHWFDLLACLIDLCFDGRCLLVLSGGWELVC